jgi:hypothetical protein
MLLIFLDLCVVLLFFCFLSYVFHCITQLESKIIISVYNSSNVMCIAIKMGCFILHKVHNKYFTVKLFHRVGISIIEILNS